MTDPRPRNNQGQFAPQGMDGIDANTTSTAYNPQVIEQRKLSLIEKIRRMRGVRNGVEESVPQQFSAKTQLREFSKGAALGAWRKTKGNFLIVREGGPAGAPREIVGKATTLGGAKKAIDRHDSRYGAVAHRVIDSATGKRPVGFSAKLRLRELARQTFEPYAPQPAQPGQGSQDFRNAAIGIGALGVGGGVAYAGWRGAQAAKSAQVLTDDALKTSAEARKAARSARVAAARMGRAGKAIKTQLTTFPTFRKAGGAIRKALRFEADLGRLRELAARSELANEMRRQRNAEAKKK